jgi:exopolyphosphatase / guanosine-5'-triphosphate,3'-diphosphate pyrophosphatase
LPEPVHIAAIDAGSNALRLSIARAHSPLDIEPLEAERYPLRLGEGVFLRQRLSEELIVHAVKAFRRFRNLMDDRGVTRYRAVATSASREARNRNVFVRRIRKKAGIELEVIGGAEESKLGRVAVLAALSHETPPACIVDLGGGSLEISLLRDGALKQSVQLPAGAVRLLTTLGLTGVIRPGQAEQVRRYVRALLESRVPRRPSFHEGVAVACGGNAETLATIASGPREHGIPTLDLPLLRDRAPDILGRDVRERMRAFGVRRDRADVLGIAVVIFLTLGRYLSLRNFLVPGVGVREGLLHELAREIFSRPERPRYGPEARELLLEARRFARRFEPDQRHAEHVRALALRLFDELHPLHHLPGDARLLLEAGALLHDVGHVVSRRRHHKHGEYLVRNGDIAGLDGWRREAVASLVRYHNRKTQPAYHHGSFGALNAGQQRLVRRLAGILRIAEALDESHRQRVTGIRADFRRGAAGLNVTTRGENREELLDAQKSAELFEREFDVTLFFQTAPESRARD